MKDKVGGKTMTEFDGLRAKTYSYLMGDDCKDKKAKCTERCVTKRKLKFENYKNCLEAIQPSNKTNTLEKSKIDISSLKTIIKNYKQ